MQFSSQDSANQDREAQRDKILSIKPGTRIADKYELVFSDNNEPTILGMGGSGRVYKAVQTIHDKTTIDRAIKFYVLRDDIAALTEHQETRPISVQSFLDEIVNLSNFNHQNILKVIEAGIWRSPSQHEIPYLITEFVKGFTLSDIIDNNDKCLRSINDVSGNHIDILDSKLRADLFLQICRGVAHLHSRRFFHCDIKPQNVFVRVTPGVAGLEAIVGDLGVGKTIPEPETLDEEQAERLEFVAGSRNYCPAMVLEHINKRISLRYLQSSNRIGISTP